uniref:Uncharacterized protein n=1 Tax=Cucumis melo TaxID=3656 RepID=A0A9I9EIC9_CUCME
MSKYTGEFSIGPVGSSPPPSFPIRSSGFITLLHPLLLTPLRPLLPPSLGPTLFLLLRTDLYLSSDSRSSRSLRLLTTAPLELSFLCLPSSLRALPSVA